MITILLGVSSFICIVLGLVSPSNLSLKNNDLKFLFYFLNDNSLKFFNEHIAKYVENKVVASQDKVLTHDMLVSTIEDWKKDNEKFLKRQSGRKNNLSNMSLLVLSNREKSKLKQGLTKKENRAVSLL